MVGIGWPVSMRTRVELLPCRAAAAAIRRGRTFGVQGIRARRCSARLRSAAPADRRNRTRAHGSRASRFQSLPIIMRGETTPQPLPPSLRSPAHASYLDPPPPAPAWCAKATALLALCRPDCAAQGCQPDISALPPLLPRWRLSCLGLAYWPGS